MTFRQARRLMFFYALVLGAILVAGGLAVVRAELWWQRALVFYGLGIPVYGAWIFGVFGFVGRARLMLAAEGREPDEVIQWGERWFPISIAVLGLIALVGIVALFRLDGWIDRLRTFFLVGPAVLVGGMGVIFCFCAIPQIRLRAEPDSSGETADSEPAAD